MDFDFAPQIDTIDKVPEQFRPLYAQGGDGKFALLDTPEVKGAVQAITGLNTALRAARAEARNRKTVDLSPLKDFGDEPQAIAQAVQARIDELSQQLKDRGNIDVNKIKEQLAGVHAKETEKLTARNKALTDQLYNLLVVNAATSAIVEEKGMPDLLLPFIQRQVKVAEIDGKFQVQVVDEAGDVRYSGVTGQPMSIAELVKTMKQQEKYGRLFDSDAPAGGGTPAGSGQRPAAGRSGTPMNPTEKIAAGLRKGTSPALRT